MHHWLLIYIDHVAEELWASRLNISRIQSKIRTDILNDPSWSADFADYWLYSTSNTWSPSLCTCLDIALSIVRIGNNTQVYTKPTTQKYFNLHEFNIPVTSMCCCANSNLKALLTHINHQLHSTLAITIGLFAIICSFSFTCTLHCQ